MMGLAWFPSASIAIFSLLVLLAQLGNSMANLKPIISRNQSPLTGQLIPHTQHGAAALLPLQLSDPNSTYLNNFERMRRRQLEGTARMALHDDLLTKGYYTTRVWIGTPAQEFALIVDSGSTVTYVPCSSCTHCGSHQDPRFAPEASSTYHPLKCKTDCAANQCNANNQCKYQRQYAEMSTSSGLLGKDVMSFGNNSMIGEGHLNFGCETIETGDLFYQTADGIMGLGRGPLSIVDQLVKQKAISNSFSLCYGGMDEGGGAMILGAITPPPDMVFTASDPYRSPYYNLDLKGLRVAGNPLPIDPTDFNGGYGTILDSGTTYAYFPDKAFDVFHDAVKRQLEKLQEVAGPDPKFPDLCFAGAGNDLLDLPKHFPSVDFVFGGGEVVSLAPENYLFRHTKVPGAYCLGIFKNGKDPTTLLGGIVVRNILVTYDRTTNKIGYWKTVCNDLWTNLPAVFPPPSPPMDNSVGMPPSPQPSPPLSGPIETHGAPLSQSVPAPAPDKGAASYVGGIEVEMTLSTNYSTFNSSVSEFLEEIAHELDVDHTEVVIISYKDQGNNVSVCWQISPSNNQNRFSKETAESFISRLQGHEIHLGSIFGAYELMSWKMIPTSPRSQWSRGQLLVVAALVVSAVVVVAIGFLVFWYLRRYRDKGRYINLQTLGDEESLEHL